MVFARNLFCRETGTCVKPRSAIGRKVPSSAGRGGRPLIGVNCDLPFSGAQRLLTERRLIAAEGRSREQGKKGFLQTIVGRSKTHIHVVILHEMKRPRFNGNILAIFSPFKRSRLIAVLNLKCVRFSFETKKLHNNLRMALDKHFFFQLFMLSSLAVSVSSTFMQMFSDCINFLVFTEAPFMGAHLNRQPLPIERLSHSTGATRWRKQYLKCLKVGIIFNNHVLRIRAKLECPFSSYVSVTVLFVSADKTKIRLCKCICFGWNNQNIPQMGEWQCFVNKQIDFWSASNDSL